MFLIAFLTDEDNKEPSVQARQYKGGKGVIKQQAPSLMTPLEISMYVLLAAFCFAIVVSIIIVVKNKKRNILFSSGVCGVLRGVRFEIQANRNWN